MKKLRRGVLELVVLGLGILFVSPLLIALNLSFRDPADRSPALSLTTDPTLDNYVSAWQGAQLGSSLLNSGIVTATSVIGVLVLGAAAAYPLARSTAAWSRWTFGAFMIGLLLPFQLALLPLYRTMLELGLLGSLGSVIIFNIGGQLPFAIFVLTGFLRAIPRDYEEAARIDGCGPLRTFALIVVPLLRPALGTVAILTAVFCWNDFLTPLLFLFGSGQETMPISLYTFVGEYTSQWSLIFGGIFIGLLPLLVAFLLLQRHIIKGFAGGLKG